MGIFRSMRQISKDSKEMRKDWDPVAQTRRGLQMMQAATAQLAEQGDAARLVATGIPAAAVILAVRDTGTRIDMQPIVELDLLVTAAGRPPYPVTSRSIVPIVGLGRLQPGAQVAVRVDAERPATAVVMWSEVPAG